LNITGLVGVLEELTGARVLEGTYFVEVPSQILVGDVVAVVLLALGISAVAAFVPAWKALAVNPVTALHE
jgi:ABC-type lipoprotein release transport system permease subunit